ncbi:MAG: cupredoxin domain-containing protein [Armatimonadota bacterium]|nr:cupredoxin domain-containing protein [Armatimonadota bacterium]MDR7426483.1 cupredoxin domain-containing protein [Armatimonadota bacterium]MDR7463380.1 cupredoxin domain-containing protein [Armatimonadota bacterium]MDR7468565.1 cupredoxin domain-containing protein [Armatimonadota bacterium]MDR7475158.1 cupredoxin domain-containing protein [Armatimonadota bacterium]
MGKKVRGHKASRRERRAARRKGRVIWFSLGALAVLSAAGFLVASPFRPGPAPSEPGGFIPQVYVDMAGFEPRVLTAPAGREFRVQFINPDSRFHTDGGGWHQFRIGGTDIDVRIPPSTRLVVTLPPLAAGTYEFYCDVCCGGKENPAMRGMLEVRA